MNRLFWITPFLLFLGCEERFPVYSKFCQANNSSKIECLRYDALMEDQDKTRLEKALGLKDDPNCKNLLQLIKYRVNECNNPLVKSTGSDFDGYIRIQVNQGLNCYYKVQSDFKNDMEAAYQRVIEKSQKELLP